MREMNERKQTMKGKRLLVPYKGWMKNRMMNVRQKNGPLQKTWAYQGPMLGVTSRTDSQESGKKKIPCDEMCSNGQTRSRRNRKMDEN